MFLSLWIDWLLGLTGYNFVSAPESQDIVVREYVFNLTQAYRNPAGLYRTEFLVNSQSPGPLIIGDENDWIKVTINNFLPVSDSIHFHGILQKGSPWADGVPGVTQYPILSGDSYTYYFQLKDHSGPAWYHSHHRGYSADGIYGPIYVRPSANSPRPYNLITNNSDDLELIRSLENSPQFILVEDLFEHPMDSNIAKMFDFGIEPTCINAILLNGKGRVYCNSKSDFHDGNSKVVDSMGCIQDLGCSGYADLRPNLDHESLESPGFSTSCKPTTGPMYTLFTNGSNWQYLTVINTGSLFTKVLSIDDHFIYVVAIDGIFIRPQKAQQVQLPVGSRFTCLVETKASDHKNTKDPFLIRFAATLSPQFIEGIGMLVYGSHKNIHQDTSIAINNGVKHQNIRGELLGDSSTIKIEETVPYLDTLKNRGPSDHTFHLYLNRTGVIDFSMFMNGTKIPAGFEMDTPLYFEQQHHDFILNGQTEYGDTIDIIINNYRRYNHPIHLHGHVFHLISFSNSSTFSYSSIEEFLQDNNRLDPNLPYFDSVLVPPSGHAVIRFQSDNPGYWLIHCHNLAHLLGGMGAVIVDSIKDIPEVPEHLKLQTHVEYPIKPQDHSLIHDSSID